MILGSNQDCVKGLYMANAIDYLSELFFNISKNFKEPFLFSQSLLTISEKPKISTNATTA